MRTQIVATLGPACDSQEMVRKFVDAGMSVARINFSHASEEEFLKRKRFVATAAKKAGKKVVIMQDLQGPRIRVGKLPPEGCKLIEGGRVVFSTKKEDDGRSAGAAGKMIVIDSPRLHKDMKKGERIYLANGDMELEVVKIVGSRIAARVVRGGTLYSRKGVNLPDTKLSNAGLTRKDIRDVKFALAQGVRAFAISFVQSAKDVEELRRIVGSRSKIIAKIETALALRNIDEIIRVSDAIMIARGDLGIEIAPERPPFIQKHLIRQASWHGKGTITATQMLMSMVDHARPTRAEVSDVANAVWDGTDAVMLSDETANGKYPLEALKMMARIITQAESSEFARPNPLADW